MASACGAYGLAVNSVPSGEYHRQAAELMAELQSMQYLRVATLLRRVAFAVHPPRPETQRMQGGTAPSWALMEKGSCPVAAICEDIASEHCQFQDSQGTEATEESSISPMAKFIDTDEKLL